ncbi:hypothetical protein EDD18DRAFT_688202 [Armillaria luteobubalina]|uniref:Uncharacterized protein n=1 Tax=Armillaria luteobubalina TaxID=153913 RepID=A0AA39TWG3_9AGAR|nr:hypothetical protein EDD18DRAFT_688202 [Armillaria luteobubalina]
MSDNQTQFGVPTGYSSVFYGYVLSSVLFGITLVQAWNYIATNSDNWGTRIFVALLLSMDSVTTSLSIQIMHHYLINNFGNLDSLEIITYSFDAQLGITVIVVFIVNIFFAVKIYRRRPANWLPVPILVFAAASLAFGLAFVVNCALRPEVGTAGNVQKVNIASTHATATAASLVITIGLALSQSRKWSGSALHRFFTYCINYGVLMTAAQAITVLLYAIDTSKLCWMVLYLGMNKVYIISVGELNHESRLGVDHDARVGISIGNIAFNDTSNQDGAASANAHSTNLNLSTQHTTGLPGQAGYEREPRIITKGYTLDEM